MCSRHQITELCTTQNIKTFKITPRPYLYITHPPTSIDRPDQSLEVFTSNIINKFPCNTAPDKTRYVYIIQNSQKFKQVMVQTIQYLTSKMYLHTTKLFDYHAIKLKITCHLFGYPRTKAAKIHSPFLRDRDPTSWRDGS